MSGIESAARRQSHDAPQTVVVIGTRAQLIKMAPVMIEMEKRCLPYRLILTGQHGLTMDDLLREFQIGTRPEPLFEEQEITGVAQMMFWFPRAIRRLVKAGGGLGRRKSTVPDMVLVHGDTASTLVASLAGRMLGATVAHVEAGLRSFRIFDPFPEEMVRVLVGRLSSIAFAPGEWATSNLDPKRLEIVNTGANTLYDTVRFALKSASGEKSHRSSPYCVVSIHRFETLVSKNRMRWLIDEIGELEDTVQVVFVLHPATRRNLVAYKLYEKLEKMTHVELRNRMTYVPFIQMLQESRFVITDGGSNQEELAYMQKPALILRNSTERQEGLDAGAELCGFDRERFRSFIDSVGDGCPEHRLQDLEHQPSKMIVDRLLKHRRP